MQVSDQGASRIGPQEGPVRSQVNKSITSADMPLADGVEQSARATRKPPGSQQEVKTNFVRQRVAAINAGQVGQVAKVAISSKQTQVLPRQKATPPNQPTTSSSVDRLRAAAAGLTREQVAAKIKGTEAPGLERIRAAASDMSRDEMVAKVKGTNETPKQPVIDRLRAAAANMSHEEMIAKVKGLSNPAAPPKAPAEKSEVAIGKEEVDEEEFVPDDDIVIYDEALGPQTPAAKEPPKPNLIKEALSLQLLESKDGVRGSNLKPEAERKEMASSFAMGYKLTGTTTEQLMSNLKGILTDPNSAPHEKEFAVDTLKSWVDQRIHQSDLENKETMTAFKELVQTIPANRQGEVFAGQSSPLMVAKKPSALTSMREAQDPVALMKRVRSGNAKPGDVLAAATAIYEKATNRHAMISPSNVAKGNVLADAKRWDIVDPSIKQSVKSMNAFTMHMQDIIDNAKNAKEAANELKFYYKAAGKLAELGDIDSAFSLHTAIAGFDIYEKFKERFGDESVKGGWDGFTNQHFGDPAVVGSLRNKLEALGHPTNNFKTAREAAAMAGPGKGILPMAVISKHSSPALAEASFVTEKGQPDIEQLIVTKKAVFDPLLNLRDIGQANRTVSHPLHELFLPQAMMDKATASSSA
ncbi:MAG: hypothetical protein LLF94_12730 [Chlamydiales bacterium]|nr:hypothetical protein [Chlamydiales bacterium]